MRGEKCIVAHCRRQHEGKHVLCGAHLHILGALAGKDMRQMTQPELEVISAWHQWNFCLSVMRTDKVTMKTAALRMGQLLIAEAALTRLRKGDKAN